MSATTAQRRQNRRRLAVAYPEAFELFDNIDTHRTALEGTLAILTLVIDADRGYDEDVMMALERHLKDDYAKLEVACNAARDAILSPLHAIAHPDAPHAEAAIETSENAGLK